MSRRSARRLPYAALLLALGILSANGCSCGEDQARRLPPKYTFDELFTLEEINASRQERLRLGATYMDVVTVEADEITERVSLTNKVDLIVVLDRSASMQQENRDFLHGSAAEFLDRLAGGRVEDIDLRVKFLGAGAAGHVANLTFGDLVLRRDLRDSFEEDAQGQRTYRYAKVRAYMQAQLGLSEAELQAILTEKDPGWDDPLWEQWDAALLPGVLGGEAFDARFGAETFGEWMELYIQHAMPSRGDQGELWASVLRYAAARPDGPDFPRRDALVSIFLLTDDQENGALPLTMPDAALTRWPMYAAEACPTDGPETHDAAQPCKLERYVEETYTWLTETLATPNVRIYGMSCSEVLSPDNPSCALTSQSVRQGSTFRPPYKRLTERSGGMHSPLPWATTADEARALFRGNLDAFAQSILRNSERRFRLEGVPRAATVRISYEGKEIPRADLSAATPRGFVCVDPRGPERCQDVRIVGIGPDELPVTAQLTVTYLPLHAPEPQPTLTMTLSRQPRPGALEVSVAGQRLAPDAYTLDAATRTLTIPTPPVGMVRARYLQDPDDPSSRSVLLELTSLPLRAPVHVIHQGALLPWCPLDQPEQEREGCVTMRDYRFVELWRRREASGAWWPADGAHVEIVYPRRERFADTIQRHSRTLHLARTPSSADRITLWRAPALPEAIASTARMEETPLPDRETLYRGFEPIPVDRYALDLDSRTITLKGDDWARGEAILVTYELSAPAAGAALSAELRGRVDALRVITESCEGPDGDDPERTVMQVIDDALVARLGAASVGEPVGTLLGPARPVSGIEGYPDFLLYESLHQPGGCAQDAALKAAVAHGAATALIAAADYPLATCYEVSAIRSCPGQPGQQVQLAALLAELGRHAPSIFVEGGSARQIALLELSRDLLSAHLDAHPDSVSARANLAFVHTRLASLQSDQAEALLALARAQIVEAATLGNTAMLFDLLASYMWRVFNDPDAARDAERRAAALDPSQISQTGGSQALSGTTPTSSPTTGARASQCGGDGCEKVKCELVLWYEVGVHPAVTIGKNVQNAVEYAICELLTGGCFAACQASGGKTSAACLGNRPSFDNVDRAADLLSSIAGGGPFSVGGGLNQYGDSSFSANVSVNVTGGSVSAGVKGDGPSFGQQGGGGRQNFQITDVSAGAAGGGGSTSFSYDRQNQRGSMSFGGGVSASDYTGHSMSLEAIATPSPEDGEAMMGCQ